MEEIIAEYIADRSEVEIKVEFSFESHDYLNCHFTDLTEDGYAIFEVNYMDPEDNSVSVSEIVVPLKLIVRIATVKSSTKL